MNKVYQAWKLRNILDKCFGVWQEMDQLLADDPTLVDQLPKAQRQELLNWATGQWASYPQLWVQRLKELETRERNSTLEELQESVCDISIGA